MKALIASNIPALLFLLLVLALFYRSVRDRLLPRVSAFKAFGIEASFAAAWADTCRRQ